MRKNSKSDDGGDDDGIDGGEAEGEEGIGEEPRGSEPSEEAAVVVEEAEPLRKVATRRRGLRCSESPPM